MYNLDFAQDFFFDGERGEPYESVPSKRPTSVWQAIISMSQKERNELARSVFNLRGKETKFLTPERIFTMIRSTDTCSNLNSPVKVWIDPAGDFTIKVY